MSAYHNYFVDETGVYLESHSAVSVWTCLEVVIGIFYGSVCSPSYIKLFKDTVNALLTFHLTLVFVIF